MTLPPVIAAVNKCFETIALSDEKITRERLFCDESDDNYLNHEDAMLQLVKTMRGVLKSGVCTATQLLNDTIKKNKKSYSYQQLLNCHQNYMRDIDLSVTYMHQGRYRPNNFENYRTLRQLSYANFNLMIVKNKLPKSDLDQLHAAAASVDFYLEPDFKQMETNPVFNGIDIGFQTILLENHEDPIASIHLGCHNFKISKIDFCSVENIAETTYKYVHTQGNSARAFFLAALQQDEFSEETQQSSPAFEFLSASHEIYLKKLDENLASTKKEYPSSSYCIALAEEKIHTKYLLDTAKGLLIGDEFDRLYGIAWDIDHQVDRKPYSPQPD